MNEERTSIGFLARLFGTFAKVGVMTFGGGYAMLPILQREIVEDRHWATEEELMDYYAVGQCTPGIIAVNTATFIGQKKAGIAGGIMATLGVVFPSIVIIFLIASVLTHFADAPVVRHAFAGIPRRRSEASLWPVSAITTAATSRFPDWAWWKKPPFPAATCSIST